MMWKTAIHCISTLDALISLTLYFKTSGVAMCRPKFSLPSEGIEVSFLCFFSELYVFITILPSLLTNA